MTREQIEAAISCMQAIAERIRARAKGAQEMAARMPTTDEGLKRTYELAARRAIREASEIDYAIDVMRREAADAR